MNKYSTSYTFCLFVVGVYPVETAHMKWGKKDPVAFNSFSGETIMQLPSYKVQLCAVPVPVIRYGVSGKTIHVANLNSYSLSTILINSFESTYIVN